MKKYKVAIQLLLLLMLVTIRGNDIILPLINHEAKIYEKVINSVNKEVAFTNSLDSKGKRTKSG